jgi:hypothetical protein
MSEKFDPAPFDKYADSALDAIRADRETSAKLKASLLGGSFPASDPLSATLPSPSKYDEGDA